MERDMARFYIRWDAAIERWVLTACGERLGTYATRQAAVEDKACFQRSLANFEQDFDYSEVAAEFGTGLANAVFGRS
jgi:hypothetical protein